MKLSSCCGAEPKIINNDASTEDFGICPDCHDHCDYDDYCDECGEELTTDEEKKADICTSCAGKIQTQSPLPQ